MPTRRTANRKVSRTVRLGPSGGERPASGGGATGSGGFGSGGRAASRLASTFRVRRRRDGGRSAARLPRDDPRGLSEGGRHVGRGYSRRLARDGLVRRAASSRSSRAQGRPQGLLGRAGLGERRRPAGRRPASGRSSAGRAGRPRRRSTVFSIARAAQPACASGRPCASPGHPGRRDDEDLGAGVDQRAARARGSAGRSRSSARPASRATSTTTGSGAPAGQPVGLAVAEGVVEVDLAVRRRGRRRGRRGC